MLEVENDNSFEGKVVFITGGASGLGKTLVLEFLNRKAYVAFTYFSSEKNAMELVNLDPENILAIHSDASCPHSAKEAISKTIEHFNGLDILVNNAVSTKDSSLLNLEYENFDYTLKHVLYPVYNHCKAACNYFVSKNSGNIINIGSINGERGREGSVAYCTAKAGVEGFTKTIAKELGAYNINCNVISPGFIDTDGQKNTSELIKKKAVLDECAIRRLTQPLNVAHLVLFLASQYACNITGQVYRIDCGQYI